MTPVLLAVYDTGLRVCRAQRQGRSAPGLAGCCSAPGLAGCLSVPGLADCRSVSAGWLPLAWLAAALRLAWLAAAPRWLAASPCLAWLAAAPCLAGWLPLYVWSGLRRAVPTVRRLVRWTGDRCGRSWWSSDDRSSAEASMVQVDTLLSILS